MPSDFDQQFEDAFESLADVHGERKSVVFFLFEQKDKPIKVDDVIVHLGGESDEQNPSTRKRELDATLSFDLKQLPRTPMVKDYVELPGNDGRWSFRAITEQVGSLITCRFTKPEQTRHGGGNR